MTDIAAIRQPAGMTIAIRLLLVVSFLSIVVSCAGPATVRDEEQFALLEEVIPEEPLTPDVAATGTGAWTYRLVELEALLRQTAQNAEDGDASRADDNGAATDRDQRVIRTSVPHASGYGWTVTLGPERTIRTAVDGADRLVLLESVDEPNDARTVYDPPIVLMHESQEPGRTYEQSSQATVWSIRNPDREVDQGSVESSVTYECDQVISSPATGKVLAKRVHRTLDIDFVRADVQTTETVWYVPSFGRVWQHEKERVSIIGPLGWSRIVTLELTDYVADDQAAESR